LFLDVDDNDDDNEDDDDGDVMLFCHTRNGFRDTGVFNLAKIG